MGLNQVVQWLGYEPLDQFQALMSGFILIMVLYVIPSAIFYLIAARKVRKYFPVTNEVVREHREFFLKNIEQEIVYLQQAVDAFRERGVKDDYNLFFEGLQTMKEIQSRILVNEELQREHLKTLNQVFNRGYLMKKL
jgi:hypothetical protein